MKHRQIYQTLVTDLSYEWHDRGFAQGRGLCRLCQSPCPWSHRQRVNDYDAIFSTLSEVGFNSWISIEDGMNGMDELRESVRFLKTKIDRYFSA